jgi:hypothetical protein
MGQKRLEILVLGWMLVVAGYVYALLLIRGIFLGITQGFTGHPNPFWLVLAYLLAFALGLYFFTAGRRAISIGKGNPRPAAQFGWGRMLLGAALIFGGAINHFHVFPIRHFGKPLQYANRAQATAGNITTVVLYIGCVFLIVWGIWKGFRRQGIRTELGS